MGVSKNRGTPKMDGLQWKTLLKMDDLGGSTPHINSEITWPLSKREKRLQETRKHIPTLGKVRKIIDSKARDM